MKLPHRFLVFGKPWTMRWGDPSRELLDSKKEWGCCVESERRIILNPTIRGNRLVAAEAFVHELMHAFNAEAKRQRVKGWVEISHAAIHRQEAAWGAFFFENDLTSLSGSGAGSSGRGPASISCNPKRSRR